MRRRFRQLVPLSVLVLAMTACAGDDTDANGDTRASGDATAEDVTDDGADVDADAGADEDEGADEDAADDEPSGSAVVTWDGETYEYGSASCRASVSSERFQMRASGAGEDQPDLDVRFELMDDEQGDFTRPASVAIFFNRGATIGEGEGYEARGDDAAAGVEADETGTSGALELEPDNHSMADEVNPDGGTLEFELTCP